MSVIFICCLISINATIASHHKLTKAWVNDELISEPDADVLFDKVYNTLSDRNKVEKVSTIPYPKETIWEKFRELSSPKPGV